MLKDFFHSLKNDFRLILLRKNVDYDKAIHYYFIDKGVAYISCKVTGLDDVICHYSVPGYEILSEDFSNYLERIMEHIPEKYPLVLEITGHKFSPDEQTRIEDAIWTQFELRFGSAQKQQRSNIIRIIWFTVFLVLSVILLMNTQNMVYEMAWVLFWFFGDRLIEYILLDELDISRKKMHIAQILSMKVVFTEKYSDDDLSEREAASYRSEVIENVMDDEI